MGEALRYTALALAAVFAALFIKKQEPQMAFLLTLGAGVVTAAAIVAMAGTIKEFALQLSGRLGGVDSYVWALFRVLGITAVTRIGAQVCRDAGEGALAMKLETVGNAMGIVTALPLFSALLSLAAAFFGV